MHCFHHFRRIAAGGDDKLDLMAAASIKRRVTRIPGHADRDIRSQLTGAPAGFVFRKGPHRSTHLAKLSLELARADAARKITGRHVHRVVDDLRRHQSMPLLRGAQA